MKVFADENIPFAKEAFGEWGQVVTGPGRTLTSDRLKDVDVLIVRSVTRVGPELLEGTSVRFVGTCTIGTDHIDADYLRQRGIGFASAPGSNAESVAEYVVAALLTLAERRGTELSGQRIGVVGVGNVGSRVARNAEALGMQVLLNDPPLQRATGDAKFSPLEELHDVDVLTLHVPLTRSGPDPTWHLVDAAFLETLRPGAILINTSRGAVVDGAALLRALQGGRLGGAVLDVWEDEPDIDVELLRTVDLGTPHIAGYSFDGKVRATEMIYQAACRFFGREPRWSAAAVLDESSGLPIQVDPSGQPTQQVIREVVRRVYDIERDDRNLRRLLDLAPANRPAHFDALRKNYPRRREFPTTKVVLRSPDQRLARALRTLRFRLDGGANQ